MFQVIYNVIAITLLAGLTAFGQVNVATPDAISTHKVFKNYVKNPSCRFGKLNITATTSANISKGTTTPLDDVGTECALDSTASGETFSWATNTFAQGLKGQNCEATFAYEGDASLYKAYVKQGANKVTNDLQLSSAGSSSREASINFPCGDLASATTVVIESTSASAAAISVAKVYVGLATNLGSVAQAQLIGQIKVSGCAGSWSTTSTSFAAFSAQTGCTYTVLQGSGNVSAPATNIPGIKFSNIPPGNYVLKYEGTALSHWVSSAGSAIFQFWDGTNSANESSYQGDATTGGPYVGGSGIQQTISYSAPQSNITLSVRGKASASGAEAWIFGTTSNPGVISVYWYPTQSQQAINSNTTPTYAAKTWFGTGATTNLVGASAAASTTRTNLSAATLATYTRFGNAVDDASTNYQVTTTLPAGVYEVKFQGRLAALSPASAAAATGCVFEIYDGTSAVASVYATALPNNYGAGGETVSSIAGYISLASPTTKTFIVRAAKINGDNNVNAYCFSSVDSAATMSMLSVTPIGYVLPMPILVGSVTSNSAGSERQERVRFSNGASASCSSTPCTIDSQSGSWITGVTRSATGTYSVAIATGMFTAAPTCVCTAYDTAAAGYSTSCSIGSASTSSISVGSHRSGVGMIDSIVSIQCMGPR